MQRDPRRNTPDSRDINDNKDEERLEGFSTDELADHLPKNVLIDRPYREDSDIKPVTNHFELQDDDDDDDDDDDIDDEDIEEDLILGDEDELDEDDIDEVADVEIDDDFDEDDIDEDDLVIDADDDEEDEDMI